MKRTDLFAPHIIMRFIDLASDGGCSKKANAEDLECLLGNLGAGAASIDFGFPDCGGCYVNGANLLATVDTLFPMVPDAEDFGKIVVNHVLSDIYASFGRPKFALAHLGIPYSLDASSPLVIRMMNGALEELSAVGIPLIGGHTLAKQSDLSLGFSVVGIPMAGPRLHFRPAAPGDPIFLTKPLGSSAASLLWKLELAGDDEFKDILEGMKQRSELPAELLNEIGVTHSTDVTGFGLVNHVHRLLLRVRSAAQISIDDLPIYSSLKSRLKYGELLTTSLYFDNAHFAARYSNAQTVTSHFAAPLLFDAQVAGGLVFTIPIEHKKEVLNEFAKRGLDLYCIGRCSDGRPGDVSLR